MLGSLCNPKIKTLPIFKVGRALKYFSKSVYSFEANLSLTVLDLPSLIYLTSTLSPAL